MALTGPGRRSVDGRVRTGGSVPWYWFPPVVTTTFGGHIIAILRITHQENTREQRSNATAPQWHDFAYRSGLPRVYGSGAVRSRSGGMVHQRQRRRRCASHSGVLHGIFTHTFSTPPAVSLASPRSLALADRAPSRAALHAGTAGAAGLTLAVAPEPGPGGQSSRGEPCPSPPLIRPPLDPSRAIREGQDPSLITIFQASRAQRPSV